MSARPIAGILHTVPGLVPVFHQLIGDRRPGVDLVHIADPELLATAISDGVTDEVSRHVADHVRDLASRGASAVLVTCSSIGEAAEAAAQAVDIPVIRVDAAMAHEAAKLAGDAATAHGRRGRIAVLATLEATLGPTGRLVDRAIAERGADAEATARVVPDAAAARSAGDQETHDRLIAEAVAAAERDADVIVLAQASMAPAAEKARVGIPVLSSPESGADSLVAALKERR